MDLINDIVRSRSIIFERSWQLLQVPDNGKCQTTKDSKNKDQGNYRPDSLTSFPEKIKHQIIPKDISNHIKYNKMIGNSHNGFIKGKNHA